MDSEPIQAPASDLVFLKSIGLFQGLTDRELRSLHRMMTCRAYRGGHTIFKPGDLGTDLLIIRDGHVAVSLPKGTEEIQLTSLGPGAYFGEMALFDEYPRSANVVATTDVTLLELGKGAFFEFVDRHPIALVQMCKVFSHRLRNTNSVLTKH